MIRRRGENISSMELERAVLSHPAVAETAAVGVPSEMSDEDVLIAVVPRAGQTLDARELSLHLQAIVPRFANPRFIRVVEALPKTQDTMRVQRHLLRAAGIPAGTWDRHVELPEAGR